MESKSRPGAGNALSFSDFLDIVAESEGNGVEAHTGGVIQEIFRRMSILPLENDSGEGGLRKLQDHIQ